MGAHLRNRSPARGRAVGVLSSLAGAVVLLASCSHATTPGVSAKGSGGKPGSGGGGSTLSAGGSSHPTGSGVAGGGSVPPTTATPPSVVPAGSTAASQALSRYLGGLAGADASAVSASSTGAPLAMAAVLLDTEAINASRGATTTVTIGSSSLTPSSTSATSVTYAGAVFVSTKISGPKGSGTFTDAISGPVTVVAQSGTWRVTSFTYDNKPLVEWPQSSSKTVNGLEVDLGFVVSYGNVTAALITLGQLSGSKSVTLKTVTLNSAAGSASGVSDFTGPPRPNGVLRFSRIGAAPTELLLHFTDTSGSAYDYDFHLSG